MRHVCDLLPEHESNKQIHHQRTQNLTPYGITLQIRFNEMLDLPNI
jgi:hypothetical protein